MRDWAEYRLRLDQGLSPVEETEVLDVDAQHLEELWLALRTMKGIELPTNSSDSGQVCRRWVEKGWAESQGGRLRLSPLGWLIMDRLVLELEEAGAG